MPGQAATRQPKKKTVHFFFQYTLTVETTTKNIKNLPMDTLLSTSSCVINQYEYFQK